jgi:deoxyribose-phosphate aldolase
LQAIQDGADELDFVVPRPLIHAGERAILQNYFEKFRALAPDKIFKAILETGNLTRDEIEWSGKLAVDAGWDFLKTSTGYGGKGGATPETVEQLVAITQGRARVKASGGIRTKEEVERYINLGATRIGTSSGVAIVGGSVQNRGSSY